MNGPTNLSLTIRYSEGQVFFLIATPSFGSGNERSGKFYIQTAKANKVRYYVNRPVWPDFHCKLISSEN